MGLSAGAAGSSAAPAAAPAQRRTVSASPVPAGSPVVLSAAPVRRDAPAPAGAPAGSAPALRLPSDGPQVVTVDSTDGQGVWVRRQPAGEPIRVWPDGSPMLVVGDDRFADGRAWRNVTTLD